MSAYERERASEKRVRQAIHAARTAATSDPALADIRLKRFHRAMDALEPGEGELVYKAIRREGWYEQAAKVLARS